jgi:glycosyltransferase involved in cell wall biosynthesis
VFVDSDALRLLFVGTWLDRKGVFYLVDSFSALAPRLPQLSLTVAGCILSEEEVRARFPAALQGRVTVLPFVNREAMPSLYAAHDIFVFPSLMEGMPLTLLEAMAGAMPIVTTDICGMADVIEDGVNGLLVPPADSSRFAAAIEALCRSVEPRKALGSSAQTTPKRYTWAQVTRKLELLLDTAVRARGVATSR